jgi:hypothetical protein
MAPEKLEMHQRLQGFYMKKITDYNTPVPFYCLKYRQRNRACTFCSAWNIASADCPASILTPLPIDRDNPKRGLWGMVKSWKIVKDMNLGVVELETNFGTFVGKNLETALLMALLEQEKL